MANNIPGKNYEKTRKKILFAAATSFLDIGYTATTIKNIAKKAEVSTGTLQNIFKTKEDILSDLVSFVLEGQFEATKGFLKELAKDKILFYAAETTLQLYMAESSEKIRDLYSSAYSLPKTTQAIQHTITEKLEDVFKEHLPDLETKDFFKLEIASGGIMRGFMMIPCDIWFTMDQKVASFLETTFRVYCVPDEKIQEAIKFVSQFDYPKLAQDTIDSMLSFLEDKIS